jgi:hypothetical protein
MVQERKSNKPEPVSAPALTKDKVAVMLHRADIILTHGGGPTSRVIRWFTQSYWNHAAIVFVLSDAAEGSQQGYQRTFILEAESHGIDIHPIDKYLCNDRQDMVILRFPGSALPAGSRGVDFLRRVRGFAVEEIDALYGYGTILMIAEKILGPLGWLLKPIIRGIRVAASSDRKKAINDFICSGVVQYAYYRACFGAEPATDAKWDPFFQDAKNRRNLIVNPGIRAAFDAKATFQTIAKQLKLTTPADFSRAAADDLLECVAERVKGVWRGVLTQV